MGMGMGDPGGREERRGEETSGDHRGGGERARGWVGRLPGGGGWGGPA